MITRMFSGKIKRRALTNVLDCPRRFSLVNILTVTQSSRNYSKYTHPTHVPSSKSLVPVTKCGFYTVILTATYVSDDKRSVEDFCVDFWGTPKRLWTGVRI